MNRMNDCDYYVALITAAGVLTMKVISVFRPKYVIMVGIAAGVAYKNAVDQIYGDVVVPDIVWDYSSGKFVSSGRANVNFGGVGFIPRPHFINTDESVLEAVERAMESPKNEYHVYIGPMACGSTVVANSEVVEKQIHSQYGNTAALDMESYAVMYAVKEAPVPRPKGLVIKSVCVTMQMKKNLTSIKSLRHLTVHSSPSFCMRNF